MKDVKEEEKGGTEGGKNRGEGKAEGGRKRRR